MKEDILRDAGCLPREIEAAVRGERSELVQQCEAGFFWFNGQFAPATRETVEACRVRLEEKVRIAAIRIQRLGTVADDVRLSSAEVDRVMGFGDSRGETAGAVRRCIQDLLEDVRETLARAERQLRRAEAASADDGSLRWIPLACLEYLRARIKKLNRRAAKLSCPLVELTIEAERLHEWEEPPKDDWLGIGRPRLKRQKQVQVRVEGEAPVLAGWQLQAVVEHTASGNLIHKAPGVEGLSDEYRTMPATCDHCAKSRARKETFVVRHAETGEVKRVGRRCLRDFLGHHDPKAILDYASIMLSIERALSPDDYLGWLGEQYWELVDVLRASAAAIMVFGWVSRGAVRAGAIDGKGPTVATADRVGGIMGNWDRLDREDREALQAKADRAMELADETLAWAQEIPPTTGDDYLANLRVLAHEETISATGKKAHRTLGLAVSMVSAYQRHTQREQEREERRQREAETAKTSEYIGEAGKRGEFTLRLTGKRYLDSQYGVTTLHLFQDLDGNQAAWFASSADLEEGRTYRIKATVKRHEEYKGVKRTTLSRCTVVENGEEGGNS